MIGMRFDRVMMKRRSLITKLLSFIAGICMGVILGNWSREDIGYSKQCLFAHSSTEMFTSQPRTLTQEFHTKRLLFVGVMTTEKYIESRAPALYGTWGSSVPGKMMFFAANNSNAVSDLPLVRLNGVDDGYPPKRKSIMMLKYMHDHYIDQFEYFMRSDDDVYVRTDKLETFLRSLDSSRDLFIGQAGVGTKSERGGLGLGPTDNFCMGGPGIVISRSVLKKLAPHLDYCFQNIASKHEDVKVGRCIKKHVGVDCTWAFEMQWLFYHNQSKTSAFHWDLETKAVLNAITLHPVKDPKYMYRLHAFFLKKNLQAVQHKSITKANLLWHLSEGLNGGKTTAMRVAKFKETKDLYLNIPSNSTCHWEFFNSTSLFSTMSMQNVKIRDTVKKGLNKVLRDSLIVINKEAWISIFRELVLSKVNLGYHRVYPTHGVQYLLDLRMNTFQHFGYGRRQLPLNIHYQVHMQQLFGNLVYRSSTIPKSIPNINIVMPLAGRLRAFATFLSNFERVVLMNNENVQLLIMYFPDVSSYLNHQKIVHIYQENYPSLNITWLKVQGQFSRALALQIGSTYFGQDSLLFLCDVDLVFNVEFLQRCRQHTSRGKQVYFPMVFSQFNQTFRKVEKLTSNLHKDKGFWRNYAFGIVCAYSGDIQLVGGFDMQIQGWGLEDVLLYEKFVSSGRFNVFRAPDPGLIHIYHLSSCSSDLKPSRLKMCHASKISQLASASSLVYHMESKGYL